MSEFTFLCNECGARYSEDRALYVCPACSRLQLPGGFTRGVLRVELAEGELPRHWPDAPLASPEGLAPFLPVRGPESFFSFAAGGSPLLPVPRLRETLRMPRLYLKDDTRNPSGSTKDRASHLVVAKAIEYGYVTVAAASTGNAATALAAAGAAAGVKTVVFVPASAPPAKLVQMASYGARLVPVAGTYDQAFELSLAACARFGWYNRNTALNPFTVEGKKTASLEIARDLAPEAPDAVVVPTGDGVIIAGVAKGFADLVRCGLLPRVPRLIAVQPERSGAIARALRSGAAEITPEPDAGSVADSLTVAAPRNAVLALKDVRGSGGCGVLVSEEAILDAIPRLAAATGVFAEPAAAIALAGLEIALAEGKVSREERVVLLVTGTGLKDVPAASRRVRVPAPVEPAMEAVEALFG
ncbi:MAG: threonine synthase [Thermoanaerobaculia bacterium]